MQMNITTRRSYSFEHSQWVSIALRRFMHIDAISRQKEAEAY